MAQLFELTVLIAVPAASIEPEDFSSAHKVDKAREEVLANAMRDLQREGPSELGMVDDLPSRLATARLRRNHLAHDWWISVMPRLVSGKLDDMTTELAADKQFFESLITELWRCL